MAPSELPPLIEMEGVTLMRGSKRVLDGFRLHIASGEHVAILGPNGCGKSTLIKAFTRELYPLHDPQAKFRIFGRDTWNVFDLRPLLGIVSNDLMSLCTRDVSGFELTLAGFFSSVEVMPWHAVTEEMRARCRSTLERLEISHLGPRMLSEMSSGEARRVLIARALVHDPKALLFDEPSNSLDIFAQHELRATMRRLAASGTAILLVTHHLSDIIPEIGRVILMKGGRVVADGAKEQILTPSNLSALFSVPVQLTKHDGYYQAW